MRLFFIAINRPYCLTWNSVVMFELVFLITGLVRWISYRNGYGVLLVLLLLLLKNHWPIVGLWPMWICFVGIYLEDVHQNLLNWFRFRILVKTLFFILIGCMIVLSLFLDVIWMVDILETVNSFFRCTAKLRILCQQNFFLWLELNFHSSLLMSLLF